jgi:regulatory protein
MMGEEEQRKKARQSALRMLTYRGRSRQELIEKLNKKGFSPDIVEETVAYAISCGYVNDRLLAQELAENIFTYKGWGFSRIAATLRSRGIPPDTVETAMSSLKEAHSEEETASAIVERRFSHITFPTASLSDKRRVTNFLQRRGFSWDTISRVMKL